MIVALTRRYGAEPGQDVEPGQGAELASRRDPQHQRGGAVSEASMIEALASRWGAEPASQGGGAVSSGPELPLSPGTRDARQRTDVERQKQEAAVLEADHQTERIQQLEAALRQVRDECQQLQMRAAAVEMRADAVEASVQSPDDSSSEEEVSDVDSELGISSKVVMRAARRIQRGWRAHLYLLARVSSAADSELADSSSEEEVSDVPTSESAEDSEDSDDSGSFASPKSVELERDDSAPKSAEPERDDSSPTSAETELLTRYKRKEGYGEPLEALWKKMRDWEIKQNPKKQPAHLLMDFIYLTWGITGLSDDED